MSGLFGEKYEPAEIADPWIALAAIASHTSRIRLGPLVTPTARRRVHKLAREAVTLDHFSGGRLVLGLGLGNDRGRELSAFGDEAGEGVRGDLLDEAAVLTELWSGEEVNHTGPLLRAEGVRFLPRPVQQPRIPLWLAARGDAVRPVQRAARYDGLFPVDVSPDQFARMVGIVVAERGDLDGFDLAVMVRPDTEVAAFEARGATWALTAFLPGEPLAEVRAAAVGGPPV